MKILLVNSRAYPHIGGVENSLRFIGHELVSAGHQVKIFCFKMTPKEPDRISHEGIEIIRSTFTQSRWPHNRIHNIIEATRENIKPVIAEFNPDTIWSRSASVGLGVVKSGFKGPVFQIFSTSAEMDCRGLYLTTEGMPIIRRAILLALFSFHFTAAHRVEKKLIKSVTSIVFSKNMLEQLHRCYKFPQNSIYLISPGVNTKIFSPDEGKRLSKIVIEKIGLNSECKYVLYVGRLSGAKNIPILIDAIKELDPIVKLVLVGNGQDKDRLQRYVKRIEMGNRVIFVGSQSELLPGFYSIARVCVLPTKTESFGQVYLEAMACGTPVVGFKGNNRTILTATSEIINDGVTGYVVEDVSAKALSKAISGIINMAPEKYEIMSKSAEKDIIQRFSWSLFVEKMLKLTNENIKFNV